MGDKNWRTPRPWFDRLHAQFRFTVDAAAEPVNALLPRYWTVKEDALKQDWSGERVYCNPPYENLYPWVRKASNSSNLVVMVLPSNTETAWFHDFIWDEDSQEWRDGVRGHFRRGRLHFGDPNGTDKDAPRYANLIVVWHMELV